MKNIEKIESEEVKMEQNKKFRLVVFKNIGRNTCLYSIPVESVEEASLIYEVLTLDDLIEEKNGLSLDYCSNLWLEVYNPELEEWLDAESYEIEFKGKCSKELRNHLRNVCELGEDTTIEETSEDM